MNIPPGLTCEQYYLYLASGYAYSSGYGIMYHISQIPSQHLLSKFLGPYSFRNEELAYWLQRRHYYDFNRKGWVQATFVEPLHVQERIWRDATQSQATFLRIQQKADEVMQIMASMNLTPSSSPSQNVPSEATPTKSKFPNGTAIQECVALRTQDVLKDNLRRVQVKQSKQKSRRTLKEKVRTLPSDLKGKSEFWKNVL